MARIRSSPSSGLIRAALLYGVYMREARFNTGEVEINYAEGPPVWRPFVVLHGGAARWQHGEELVRTLASDWHVFAPDLRGHGRSGHVAGAYLLTDYVRDTARWLAAIVREPAIVFGHSLGGEVAVMLTAQHPELVSALIVADAPLSWRNSITATEKPYHRAQNELWHQLAGRPEAEINAAMRDLPMLEPGATQPRPAREVFGENSGFFAHQATSLHQLDPDMLAAVLEGPEVMLRGYDPDVLLPRITCPVLLLQADPAAGAVLRDDEIALAMQLLARPTHVRLSGIGHGLHAPPGGTAIVLDALAPFLASLEVRV
jgi:pimeloyl-ACP methyl ester carboxylesterase